MDEPKEIESVYWDEESKSWSTKLVKVEEYHGFTECRYCQKPMSYNVKTEGDLLKSNSLCIPFFLSVSRITKG